MVGAKAARRILTLGAILIVPMGFYAGTALEGLIKSRNLDMPSEIETRAKPVATRDKARIAALAKERMELEAELENLDERLERARGKLKGKRVEIS